MIIANDHDIMIDVCIVKRMCSYCDVEVSDKFRRSGHDMFKLWVGESALLNDVWLGDDSCSNGFLLLFSKSVTWWKERGESHSVLPADLSTLQVELKRNFMDDTSSNRLTDQ